MPAEKIKSNVTTERLFPVVFALTATWRTLAPPRIIMITSALHMATILHAHRAILAVSLLRTRELRSQATPVNAELRYAKRLNLFVRGRGSVELILRMEHSMVKRANPAELRKALEIAQTLAKAGIMFVPMPVVNADDLKNLTDESALKFNLILTEVEKRNFHERASNPVYHPDGSGYLGGP